MATSDKEKAEKYQLIYEPNSTTLTEKVDVYSRKSILLLYKLAILFSVWFNSLKRNSFFNFFIGFIHAKLEI